MTIEFETTYLTNHIQQADSDSGVLDVKSTIGSTPLVETKSQIGQLQSVQEKQRIRVKVSALEWLLFPLSADKFISEIWEKKPHLIKRDDRNYYSSLFTGADLDSVFEYSQLKPPDIKVMMEGKGVSSDEYLQSDGRLDINQLRRLYAEGHTIIINGLHRFWEPVAEFVQGLQRYLSYEVKLNAYLTPSSSRGFNLHYDTHEVFIVQIAGTKTWRIYCEAEPCPLLGTTPEQIISRDELPSPCIVELSAGNVMYIPRGWLHEAETVDQSSLHLTVGIFPPQWHDFLGKALIALTMKHERLRRALPVGYLDDCDVMQTLSNELRELARLLEREGAAAEAFGMLQDDFIRIGRAVPDGQFIAALDRLHSINLHTQLVKRPHLYCRVIPRDRSVAIQFSRTVVQGPADYRDAMDFIAQSHAPFSVSDLPIPDKERKISLAQRLVRDGLLNFANKNSFE